ncbi:hypothetical protein ARMGADRAFT_1066221 [Armillaria gallica]|uniref:Uncharacterized protein n=1 Tax=Armillaria gallica TaxID=47427 RepID=A0A2H3DDK2_ARMGA|nr:hypothetical protein ARMGADRAFT_1066221 [Armillaria gallica]
MNEIVYSGLTLFHTGQWFLQRETAPNSLIFSMLDDDDLSSEKADIIPEQLEKRLIHYEKENITMMELDTEATSKKEGHKGDDVSRRTYQCLYDKIFYDIKLGLQYIPPSVEDISSVNTKPLQTVERSRFGAVLIGIDAYQSYPLRGCVSDALLVEKYLKEEIGIPQGRIQRLLGSQGTPSEDPSFPSRTSIVDTLLSLVDNHQIEVGDTVLFRPYLHVTGHSSL